MSNPSTFFQALAGIVPRVLDNIVISPHIYPPSIADPGFNGWNNGFAFCPEHLCPVSISKISYSSMDLRMEETRISA